MPLLSIVIANYNFGRYLGDAIRSILDQGCGEDVEIIIVDGGSTDNSVDIIKSFGSEIAWWVSEKDRGQSDAFNKGFSRARGKMLTWLNADDVIPKGALRKILSVFRKHPSCEWFTGNHIRFLEKNKRIIQVEWGPHWNPSFLQSKNAPLVIFGPSTFFSKKIYNEIGGVDESLHLAMDTDMWLRFQARGIKQKRINCFCWAFRMHEASKTAEYDGHKHAGGVSGSKLMQEHMYSARKVGYRQSSIIRLLALMFRVFDGSIILRWVLKRKLMGRVFEL